MLQIEEMFLNRNVRRKLLLVVTLLVIAPVLVVAAYRMRQNYKEHHYITVTMRYGRYRGEKYRITEAHQDEINRQATLDYQEIRDRAMKMHHHNSH